MFVYFTSNDALLTAGRPTLTARAPVAGCETRDPRVSQLLPEARVRLTRSSFRRAALSIGVAGLVVGALTIPAMANAGVSTFDATAAGTLSAQLGDNTAGSYLDAANGKMVITVTDAAAAKRVRAAGGTAKLVAHSGAQLASAKADLDRTADVVGTALAVDPATNQVVVSVDDTVTGAKLAQVEAA